LVRFESESRTVSLFYHYFVSFGESWLLVSWCAGDRYGMAGSDEDHDRSRRPSAEDRGWSHKSVLSGEDRAYRDEERGFLD
jgi:hypothetical protein